MLMSLHYPHKKVTTDLKKRGVEKFCCCCCWVFLGGGWGGVFPEFQSNLVRVFINTRTPFELRRLFTLSAT